MSGLQKNTRKISIPVETPWTDEQVEALNAYQKSGAFHPYTGKNGEPLIATKKGWVEFPGGPVVQRWAMPESMDPALLQAHKSWSGAVFGSASREASSGAKTGQS